jgi:hypothetical protein
MHFPLTFEGFIQYVSLLAVAGNMPFLGPLEDTEIRSVGGITTSSVSIALMGII